MTPCILSQLKSYLNDGADGDYGLLILVHFPRRVNVVEAVRETRLAIATCEVNRHLSAHAARRQPSHFPRLYLQ